MLVRDPAAADAVAWFSSRGPSDFDLLAPNVAAPGVNILAAYRELGGDPEQYEIIRGTSMASPHVAGSGALLRALHPEWSPARDPGGARRHRRPGRDAQGGRQHPPIRSPSGPGLIDLAAAGRVGLVLDESYADMLAANPATGGSPRTLNVPYLVNRQCNLHLRVDAGGDQRRRHHRQLHGDRGRAGRDDRDGRAGRRSRSRPARASS